MLLTILHCSGVCCGFDALKNSASLNRRLLIILATGTPTATVLTGDYCVLGGHTMAIMSSGGDRGSLRITLRALYRDGSSLHRCATHSYSMFPIASLSQYMFDRLAARVICPLGDCFSPLLTHRRSALRFTYLNPLGRRRKT